MKKTETEVVETDRTRNTFDYYQTSIEDLSKLSKGQLVQRIITLSRHIDYYESRVEQIKDFSIKTTAWEAEEYAERESGYFKPDVVTESNASEAKIIEINTDRRDGEKKVKSHPLLRETTMTVSEMASEAQLDDTDCPLINAYERTRSAGRFLLTGATGFIGAYLLAELVKQTNAEIFCLVRAVDEQEGKNRIQTNLKKYDLWQDHYDFRIRPICGDLKKPELGLDKSAFQELSVNIDEIFHAGAMVKWTYPYRAIKKVNVDGTRDIIRLAAFNKIKPLHYISTVGIFSSNEFEADVVWEDEAIETTGSLTVGYAQSKWVAEKLVTEAKDRGLPVTIYRPNSGWHSKTGIHNPNDHLSLMMNGFVNLGSIPTGLDVVVSTAPIDYVGRSIVYLSQQNDSFGKTFHIVNPNSVLWNEFVDMVASLGYPLKKLSISKWGQNLNHIAKQFKDNIMLQALAPVFANSVMEKTKFARFDCENVTSGLVGSDINCPPFDAEYLKIFFAKAINR